MSALPSKREFLSQHTNPATGEPFAKFPSRGRFSAEAEAFAALHVGEFSDAPKPAPKAKPVSLAKPSDKPTVTLPQTPVSVVQNGADRAAVALARREGRGLVADPIKPQPVVRPGVKSLPALMPMGNGRTEVINFDLCQRCTSHVSLCACKQGPKAPAGAVPLSR